MSAWAPYMPRVAVLPWPGIEGAYLCVSGKRRRQERAGERWYPKGEEHDEQRNKFDDRDIRTDAAITFLYDAGNCCAEWDGEHGPIQLWWRAPIGWKPKADDWAVAKEHWFYPSAFGSGHWSQMAVDEEELPRRFNEGRYDEIFRVLKSWADSRNDDYATARAEPERVS